MSEAPRAAAPAAATTAGRFAGLGREGVAIVALVALVTSLNTTVKFLVSAPIEQWLAMFAGDLAAHLFVGTLVLLAAVLAHNSIPVYGARQYAVVALAVVIAVTLAEVCIETASGDLFDADTTWLDVLVNLGGPIVRHSVIGFIIASAWLYLRAEADHTAAIAACAVESERLDQLVVGPGLDMSGQHVVETRPAGTAVVFEP